MLWIVEKLDSRTNHDEICKEIRDQGHICHELEYKICRSVDDDLVKKGNSMSCLAIGSTNMAFHDKTIPGVMCNSYYLKCSTYYAYFGEYLFNDFYTMIPLKELHRNYDSISRVYGDDKDRLFVRPDMGNKLFTGQVVSSQKEAFVNLEVQRRPSMLVVASSVKEVGSEYRFFVSGKEIISGSHYHDETGIKEYEVDETTQVKKSDSLAYEFVKSIIEQDLFQPDLIFSIDVVVTRGVPAIMELNSMTCSGWYACNVKKMVSRISDIVTEEDHRRL